jgi:hypothetical protein
MRPERKGMAKERVTIDITHTPDVLRLAEEVARTGTSAILRRDSEDIAVLSPVAPASKRRGVRGSDPIPRTDSLFGIVGLIETEGPTDVSENKHKYLAEAYYAELEPPVGK